MTKANITHQESVELKHLYDAFSLAAERASAAMHMRGPDSTAFLMEDTKCAAIWGRIRELMGKPYEPWSPQGDTYG
jgi:hypothetical protein